MRALSWLRKAERFAAVFIFLMMVALYFVNVLSRQVGGTFASNFAWIEELVRLMSLFLVFLSVGLALDYGRHVAVNTWRDRFAARGLPVHRIIDFVGFFVCVYLAWLGYEMTAFVYSMGQTSPTLQVPIFWIYLAPTIGFALMALRYLLSFFRKIDRFGSQVEEDL